MTEKRFSAKPTKVTPKETDAAVVLDYEAMVTPPEGGDLVPSLKKLFFSNLLMGRGSGDILEFDSGSVKGIWAAGTTYNFGDIVRYDPSNGLMGLPLYIYFMCCGDGVTGSGNAPDLTDGAFGGNTVGVWKPLAEGSGLGISDAKKMSSGLAAGSGSTSGSSGCFSSGIGCSSGINKSVESYVYRGEYIAGTYYEGEMVTVTFGSTSIFYWCLAGAGTTEVPVGASESWEIAYSNVAEWTSSLALSVDDIVSVDEVINGTTFTFLFTVIAVDGSGNVPVKPSYLVKEGTYCKLTFAYSSGKVTSLVINESYSHYNFLPGRSISFAPDGLLLPPVTEQGLCNLSIAVADNNVVVVITRDSEPTDNIYIIKNLVGNAPKDLFTLFMLAAFGDISKINEFGAEGSFCNGIVSEANVAAASAFGISSEANASASQAVGIGARSIFSGEHSVANVYIDDPVDPGDSVQVRSQKSTVGMGLHLEAGLAEEPLSIMDALSAFLAPKTGVRTFDTLNLDSSTRKDAKCSFYIKFIVQGRIVDIGSADNGALAVYEGKCVMDYEHSDIYILRYENWTEITADAVTGGAVWVAPYVKKSEPLEVMVTALSSSKTYWSATMEISSMVIGEPEMG